MKTGEYVGAGAYEIGEAVIGETILKLAGGIVISFKKVPNPGGRLGDAVTRQTTENVIRDLRAMGYREIDTEVHFVKGPLGLKDRYADVVGVNEAGHVYIVNIGKTTKAGVPVMRERKALDDIVFSPSIQKYPGATIAFVEKGASGLL